MAAHSRPKDGVLSHAYVAAITASPLSLPGLTQGSNLSGVIAGLGPAIHEASPQLSAVSAYARPLIMDARVKPAHDN